MALVLTCLFGTTACIEDDFTSSSADLLEFSCDTVAFDTVFTELGTPTKQFVIYNRHKKMINISSISLQGNAHGRFFLNVDGMKGSEFHNVEIRGEDSIYVFVESLIDPTNQNTPLEVTDYIDFVTNGVTQKVVLTAWGQDVTRLTRPVFSEDATLSAQKPYVIFDTLFVAPGATLTIEPGVTLHFHDKAAMKIEGTLIAAGSRDRPIHLRGDRTDYLFDGANYDLMTAQWGGIDFTASSTDNELQYVLMRGSTTGITVDADNADSRALHIFNSVLHNAATSVLSARNAWIDAEGCEFSNSGYDVVNISGGKYHFVHCTFANYFLFGIKGGALINVVFEDEEGNSIEPSITIDNSILYGLTKEFNVNDFAGHNVLIRHSLLRSAGSDDDNFIQCRWDADPKFYVDRDAYVFDFRLGNESDAIAIGNPDLCPEIAAFDRYGNPRLNNGGVDMGAYVWIYADDDNK